MNTVKQCYKEATYMAWSKQIVNDDNSELNI